MTKLGIMLLILAGCGGGSSQAPAPAAAPPAEKPWDMAVDLALRTKRARVDLECPEPNAITFRIDRSTTPAAAGQAPGSDIVRIVAEGCGRKTEYYRTSK